MFESIKNELHLRINELFVEAAVCELAGDMDGYKSKLSKIVQIADVLGVDTEVAYISVNLKDVLKNNKRTPRLPKGKRGALCRGVSFHEKIT